VGADVAWIDYCRHAPDGNLLMVGKTERTLKRNVIDPMIEILGNKRCRYVGGSGELFVLGRRVYLAGANDERAEEKIRGLTLIGAYVDEISTVPETFWVMLLSRLSLEGSRLVGTTNPDSPMHWLKKGYLDRAKELDIARFQFRLYDNPHLPSSFIDAIKREFTGLWRRRMIDGEWCVAAGAIYDAWDPDRHVVPAAQLPPTGVLLCMGIDYGTTAPTAGLLLGVTAEERPRLAFVDEWAPAPMTDVGLSADLRKWLAGRRPQWFAVDPSAASFKMQLYADGISNVMDAKNPVQGGLRTVNSLLATNRLVVSDACRHWCEEVPAYAWDPKATAKGKDEPMKVDDHWCDAGRYAVASTVALWRNMVPLTMPVIDDEEAA